MRIKDIIEVPHIDKIVRLTDNMSDKADSEKLRNLLKGYVITDSVEKNLSNFFYKITNLKDKGHGFLISGLPGCGKSHFMSVLGLLIKNNDAFGIMHGKSTSIDKAKDHFKDKKIFVVPLMAEEGGPEISLEEMFFDAAENITGFPFTDDSYYIKQFEQAIVANFHYEKKVDEYVKKYSKEKFLTWANFTSKIKSSKAITKLIKAFIDENEITFFNPNRGRKDRLIYLYKWLDEESYDGVLVLIDELSEYLNDRGNGARNDAIFLKVFLENAENERNGKIIPAWIVGAFLSSLNDVKVPEVYDLMKDRFPTENQFTLKVDDVEEIIDQRLIIKKRPEKVEEAFILLKNKYNAFSNVDKNTFKKIYPLHPESLDILSKSVRFLSRQRSIVDFVLSEVKGNMDEGGNTKGILDEDFLKLVTPDRILNHFHERIRELSDKREYFETIYAYYMGPEGLGNGKVKELFKDNDSDRETAAKLIDVMTLLKVLDLEKEYTVRGLTYMILYPKMEGDFAEEKVNKILFKMYDKGRFIEFVEDESSVGGNIYFINKDVSLTTKINQDMKKKLALIEGENVISIIPEVIKTLSQEPLSISGYFNEPSTYKVNWNNTSREGVLQFNYLNKVGSKEQLAKVLNDLKNSENDFYLFIGTILENEKQKNFIDNSLKELISSGKQQGFSMWGSHEDESMKEIEKRMAKSIVYWLPSDEMEKEEGKEKLQKIKEYYAYLELFKEYKKSYDDTNSKESKQLLDKVEEKILNLQEDVFQILKGLYLQGSFYNIDGKLNVDITLYGNESLNKIIRSVINHTLQQTYISNKFINSDENLGLTDNVINKFINNYILGSKNDPSGIDESIIRNVIKKFGESHVKIDSFKFSVDAKNNNFIKAVLDEIEGKDEVVFKTLYSKIRKSSFGPDRNVTEVVFAMLIKKGFLIPIKNDIVVNITNVKAPLNTTVTKFKMGEFVDDKYHEGLIRITRLFFDKKFEKQDLSFQEELWETLIDLKIKKSLDFSEIINVIYEFKKILKLEDDKFKKVFGIVNHVKTLLEDIAENNGSKDGLEYFIEKNKDDITNGTIENYYKDFIKISEWIRSSVPFEIQNILVTVNGYKVFIPEKEEYMDLLKQHSDIKTILNIGDDFIFGNVVSNLNKRFDVFKNEFISKYLEEHNRENNKQEFEDLRSILNNENFEFLRNISRIERINMDYDFINIKSDIDKQLGSQCNESPLKFFNNGDSNCKCGFRLGQKKFVDKKDKFQAAIEKALFGYVDELNTQANKEKVFKYIKDLRELGDKKDIIALVEKIYTILLDDKRLDNYKNYLTVNPEIIEFLDKALKVNINFIQRDISKLLEIFKDKPYSKEEMIQKFTQLVQGNDEIKQNQYIKFTDLKNSN